MISISTSRKLNSVIITRNILCGGHLPASQSVPACWLCNFHFLFDETKPENWPGCWQFASVHIKYSFCKIIAELKLELWMVGGPDCASELSSQQIQTMEKLSSLGNIHNPFKPKVGLRNSHQTQLRSNWKSNFAELICQRQQHMSKIINVTIKFYRSKYSTINFLLCSFSVRV